MKYCEKCGKEIMEEAVVCPGCGFSLDSATTSTASTVSPITDRHKKRNRIIRCILIPVASVALVLGILAILILPSHDLNMKDFKDDGYVGALFHYGIPSRTNEECWIYEDIKFYGIPASSFLYEPGDSCVFFFAKENSGDVYNAIRRHCNFESSGLDIFHTFSYDDLEIVCSPYEATYVNIKFH